MAETLNKVSNFETDVLNASGQVVVDFWAEWCMPCKRLTPILESVAKDLKGKIEFFQINVNESPDIASKYGITSIPTLILFKEGKIEKTITGFVSRIDLIEWLSNE